ncbi:PP2C family protein-serine/threonine phosphatase [Erythrobacter sp. R86502]|uniref:PP2C family protein-serine/threonine phosphatase n=1 Tax=Erythrobacter sp. R86502 TaxID=3093846 RepID=UPI0036D269E7
MNALKWLFRKPVRGADTSQSVSRSDVGRVRTANEDRVLDRTDLRLWAVADGMGGHRSGDVAADFVVAELTRWGERQNTAGLNAAVLQTHEKLLELIGGQGGATLVAMVAGHDEVQICWAGDSRAYLIREGTLRQLTKDHSIVQQLLDAGLIDEATSHTHPQANVVTSALGSSRYPLIEEIAVSILPGDRVLLCSDGLSRSLRAQDILNQKPLPELADQMLMQALERDGRDNVSFVLVQFS